MDHMIQKEDAVKKVYKMHMPDAHVSVNTQTTVTWVDTLASLEDAIVNIENHTEGQFTNEDSDDMEDIVNIQEEIERFEENESSQINILLNSKAKEDDEPII